MGRITAYDQNGRMVVDFDKSGYDLMRMLQGYEDEIERLMTENTELGMRVMSLESALEGMHLIREQDKAENAKLREMAAKMAKALRVGSEWCDRECSVVFGCDGMDVECPIAKELHELEVEVK